ncbi:MAG: YraN family protein [Cyanobacteria bacterium SIG26]|nr:YraN family protein [Cyanobacteria bacterium SIG26]
MNNRDFGNKGEDLACEYLVKNGYEIIERNRHFSKLCEIDIIAKFKNRVVFVEVKTRRTNSFGTPLEAITGTKYNNIKTGVLSYLQENKIKNYQIDVIGITLEPELKIEHLKNI